MKKKTSRFLTTSNILKCHVFKVAKSRFLIKNPDIDFDGKFFENFILTSVALRGKVTFC